MGKLIAYIFEPFVNFAIQFGYHGEINTEKQDKIKRSVERNVKSSDGKWLPAALSYYVLIAFVPLLALVVLALSIVPEWRVFIENQIVNLFPTTSETLIEEIFSAISLGSIEIFSLILLIFASVFYSVRSIGALHNMAEYLYGNRKASRNDSLLWSLIRPFITLMMIILFVGAFAGGTIFVPNFLASEDVKAVIAIPELVVELLIILVQVFIFYFTILILYKVLPYQKISSAEARPGALFFSATMTIFLLILTLAINLGFSDYTSIYGSLAIIVVIGTLSLAFSYLLFYGMVINVAVKKGMISQTTVVKVPLLKRIRRTFKHMNRSYGARSIAKGVKKIGKVIVGKKEDPLFDQPQFNTSSIQLERTTKISKSKSKKSKSKKTGKFEL